MSSRKTLEDINGPAAVAELDAVRAAQDEQVKALHAERAKLLGEKALEGGNVPTEVAREVTAQALHNTGEHPVIKAQ